jgi:hypothetical protein
MRLNEFFFLLVKSLNPGDYKMLITRKKREAMQFFLMLLFFSVILGLIFSIPKFVAIPNNIESILIKFERFNITGIDIKAKEPITLLKFPKTVLDLTGTKTNITDEMIFITNSDIFWKKFQPSLFDWRLFTTEEKPISSYSNVLDNINTIKGGAYWLLFFLLLPSIFLGAYLFNFIKYVILIGLVTFIGYAIAKLKRKKVKLFEVLRTAVFASTIMIVPEIVLSPLFNFSIYFSLFPLVLYLIMFLLAMLVIEEKNLSFKNQNDKGNQ